MERITVSDSDIKAVENVLLPDGCHFADDAREVIRCWESRDVAACPGSGKTTVLLAKLKIIVDQTAFEGTPEICVLSHTNVAVNEIKNKLSNYAEKLMKYPSFVGTIQSFIDQFVTIPYVRNKYGKSVRPVDDRTYAEHLYYALASGKYSNLLNLIRKCYGIVSSLNLYEDIVDYVNGLYIDDSKNLRVKKGSKSLSKSGRIQVTQFQQATREILNIEGIVRYRDTYRYAKEAIESLEEGFTDLFSSRFRYVFVDEFQDCNSIQRYVISELFNPSKCCVFRIGDSDQAIYDFQDETVEDWVPGKNALSIASSCRYTREIADILKPLRKSKKAIVASCNGSKPVLIIYDNQSIHDVLNQFVFQLEQKGLHDPNGNYMAIGYIEKESVKGRKIGDYWDDFCSSKKSQDEVLYYPLVEQIREELGRGKLYRAESLVRELICKILHYVGIKNRITSKEYTSSTIREVLKNSYCDAYSSFIMQLVEVSTGTDDLEPVIRNFVNSLCFHLGENQDANAFSKLPVFFLKKRVTDERKHIGNVYVEPTRGRRIIFDTIHRVKGQTHDATLYLETEKSNGSDLSRMIRACEANGEPSASYDYNRKLAYVGFSRPRKLLCVAIQGKTYNKHRGFFKEAEWEIVDIRAENNLTDNQYEQMTLEI